MISSADGQPAYLGVDHRNTYNPNMYPGGRISVRISTKVTLTHGLIISDIAHMPGGICGTWPARESPPGCGEETSLSWHRLDIGYGLAVQWRDRHHRRCEQCLSESDEFAYVRRPWIESSQTLLTWFLCRSPNCTIAGDAELGPLQSNNCDTTVRSLVPLAPISCPALIFM